MYARRQRKLEAQRQAKKEKSARARSRHCLYFCHLGTSVHVRKSVFACALACRWT